MSKPRALFTLPDNTVTGHLFPQEHIEELSSIVELVRNRKSEPLTEDELVEMIPDMDIIITGWLSPRVTPRVLARANKLKLLVHAAGTVNPVITPEVYKHGMTICSTNSVMSTVTAESGIAMAMIANWETKKWSKIMAEGGWKTRETIVPGIQGNAVGIIGFGAITQAMLPYLRPFRLKKLMLHSNHMSPEAAAELGCEKADLETILRTADIIFLQTSLTPKTKFMINDENLAWIKDNALLINLGRGELIDEDALIRHLSTGRFRAVLDVFSREPLAEDSPLRDMPNVIALPHLGAATKYCRESMGKAAIENIREYLAGKTPQGMITEEAANSMSTR